MRSNRVTRLVKVGSVIVDAGIVMIGDPCYHWEDDGSLKQQIGKTWHQFCDSLPSKTYPIMKNYDGRAVVVTSGDGDGCYPVYVETDGKRIVGLSIRFDEGEEEDEEEEYLIEEADEEEGDSDWAYEADDGSEGTAKWT